MHVSQNIEQIAVADLIPYARNSRTHSDEQVAQVAASIREFGFTNPVLEGDGRTFEEVSRDETRKAA